MTGATAPYAPSRRLVVVERVGGPGERVLGGGAPRLLELLVEDLPLILRLLHRAVELLVEHALLRADAVHELVEIPGRRLLLVHPDHGAGLGVDLEERLAAGTGDVEGLRHATIVAPRWPRDLKLKSLFIIVSYEYE